MTNRYNQKFLWLSLPIYFLVLALCFYASVALVGPQGHTNQLFQSMLFASVILVCIRLGRFVLPKLANPTSWIIYTVSLNALGLVMGVLFLIVLSKLLPDLAGSIFEIVVSSVIAFFVLGTLAPLLLCDRRTNAR